jgi:c(7)-type cytochrome triheme protein
MCTGRLKYLLAVAFVLLSSLAFAEEWFMEPAPVDRVKYRDSNVLGRVKYDEYGMRKTTPDVISLEYLPKDAYGFVDWAEAIRKGVIAPRDSLKKFKKKKNSTEVAKPPFSKKILRKVSRDFMPNVIFPHTPHNVWLKCNVCHPKIFRMKAGATPITMTGIWQGKFCGRCHDKVAFPTRNCFKCHSAPKAYKKTLDQRRGGRF